MTLKSQVRDKIDYQPLPADVYEARLVDIQSKEGKWGLYWEWKFEVPEVECPDDGTLYQTWKMVFSGADIRPESGDKKPPRAIAEALLGRRLDNNEMLDPEEYEDLIGKNCRLTLSVVLGKDNKWYNQVDSVLPLRKLAAARGGATAPTSIVPDLQLAEKELLNRRYDKARRALGWNNSTTKEQIEAMTGGDKPFSMLPADLQLFVVESMEAEVEAGDIPFESPDELFPEEEAAPKTVPASAGARGRN